MTLREKDGIIMNKVNALVETAILEYLDIGLPVEEIFKLTGLSISKIKKIALDNGLTARRKDTLKTRVSKREEDEMIRLYEMGLTIDFISLILNRSSQTVSIHLRQRGCDPRGSYNRISKANDQNLDVYIKKMIEGILTKRDEGHNMKERTEITIKKQILLFMFEDSYTVYCMNRQVKKEEIMDKVYHHMHKKFAYVDIYTRNILYNKFVKVLKCSTNISQIKFVISRIKVAILDDAEIVTHLSTEIDNVLSIA